MATQEPVEQVVKATTHLYDDIIECLLPGNTLLITSKGFTQRGTTQRIIDVQSQPILVLDEVESHPDINALSRWVEQYQNHNVCNFVALGGGSVIDVVKVLSGMLQESELDLATAYNLDRPLNKPQGQVIVIPTTAGTGAEVTGFATIWDKQNRKKLSINCAEPDIVIFDPSLTISLPDKVTLYSCLDALSHALESLWNTHRNNTSQAFAYKAIDNILQGLPKVIGKPDDIEARLQLQWAAYYAGKAINITKTAVAHAISYPLTLNYGIPHGLACSFTLKAILMSLDDESLKLPSGMADNVINLLDKLALPQEMEQYGDWQEVFNDPGFYLEPSRSRNFIFPVDSIWVKSIIRKSA